MARFLQYTNKKNFDMCLECNRKPIARTTTKDTVFYKVLFEDSEGTLNTPYMDTPVKLGVEYSEKIMDYFPDDKSEHCDYKKVIDNENGTYRYKPYNKRTLYRIGYGGHHLFRRKKDAEMEIKNILDSLYMKHVWLRPDSLRVYRAIVPKDTLYVTGKYRGSECVVVKKVKYEEI